MSTVGVFKETNNLIYFKQRETDIQSNKFGRIQNHHGRYHHHRQKGKK